MPDGFEEKDEMEGPDHQGVGPIGDDPGPSGRWWVRDPLQVELGD